MPAYVSYNIYYHYIATIVHISISFSFPFAIWHLLTINKILINIILSNCNWISNKEKENKNNNNNNRFHICDNLKNQMGMHVLYVVSYVCCTAHIVTVVIVIYGLSLCIIHLKLKTTTK